MWSFHPYQWQLPRNFVVFTPCIVWTWVIMLMRHLRVIMTMHKKQQYINRKYKTKQKSKQKAKNSWTNIGLECIPLIQWRCTLPRNLRHLVLLEISANHKRGSSAVWDYLLLRQSCRGMLKGKWKVVAEYKVMDVHCVHTCKSDNRYPLEGSDGDDKFHRSGG